MLTLLTCGCNSFASSLVPRLSALALSSDLTKAPVPESPIAFITDCVSAGRVRWTYHVSMRLQQSNLSAGLLTAAVASFEVIESYPGDKYLPSFLIRGESDGVVFHAHVATDLTDNNVRIVTMYLPQPDEWDVSLRRQEAEIVSCRICGGAMESHVTDLPFKTGDFSVVILKALPVLQCRQCGNTELEHTTMVRVDSLLSARDRSAELEVIRYAA